MQHIFDAETLRSRLRDYNVVVFQIASSLVKSGVLALAAIVLIDILYAERDQAILLLLWLGSFVFAVLAFERQLYLPLATPRGGVSDVWPSDAASQSFSAPNKRAAQASGPLMKLMRAL